ncbi:hypothetical protein M758_6G106000 [Ceratodon purpureus]|nr:hypothetical protein M758_6G106000 [Ceratodon purpureus]
MERELGQIRVDSTPFVQHHQFFPGGGAKQLFPSGRGLSAVDRSDSPSWSSRQTVTNRNRSGPSSSGERAIQRDEWNAGSWRFDGGALTAQRVSRGADDSSRHASVGENGRHRRGADLGLQLDSRRSGTPEGNHEVIHIDDDESELPSQAFVGRQTPSPPSNEPNPYSRGDESPPEDDGPLTSLKLGGGSYAYFEDNGAGKRGRSTSPQSQIPTCQVDGCTADLSRAKDYHRRHKVCEAHSKATTALVSRVMQRFCQQCSRFHPLDSFDEGKRSCRRRLAGHNKRRRKTQPDAPAARAEEQAGVKNADLMTLLGVLSQLKGPLERASAAATEQDLLLQCLRQAGNLPGGALDGLARGAPSWSHLSRNPEVGLPQIDPNLLASHLNGHVPVALQPQDAIAMLLQNNLKQVAMLAGLNGNMHGAPLSYPSSNAEASVSHAVPQTYNERTSSAPGLSIPPSLRMPGSIDPAQLLANVAMSVQQSIAAQAAGQGSNMAVNGYPAAQPVVQRAVGGHPAVDTRNFLDPRVDRNQENDASVPTGRQRPAAQSGVSQSHKRSFLDLQQAQAPVQRPSIDLQQPPSEQYSDTSETGSGSGLGSGSGSGSGQQSPGTPHTEWENSRISFKLFDKHPGQFPEGLRSQIDEWLSHRPSDMEGFIRPGCIILTLFLSMPKSAWSELIGDLPRSLRRLLSSGGEEFWCTGRMLVQAERQSVLVVDGEIVECLESNPLESPYLLSVRPLAVVAGQQSRLVVSGLNLTRAVTRLLCAFRGRYYTEEVDEQHRVSLESVGSVNREAEELEDTARSSLQDAAVSSAGETDSVRPLGDDEEASRENEEYGREDAGGGCDDVDDEISVGRHADTDGRSRLSSSRAVFNLDCNTSVSSAGGGSFGRCFIEVDQDTLEGNWKPVIVADGPVCAEIRTLEDEIEVAGVRAGRVAEEYEFDESVVVYCSELARLAEEEDVTQFLHELGWFFQRSYFRSLNCPSLSTLVSSTRFRQLLVYSVERNWCAVVQKVLDIAFENDEWEVVFTELGEMSDEEASLLHRAVRNRNRRMVELLLGFAPSFLGGIGDPDVESFKRKLDFRVRWGSIFKADMRGPGGLSPLHIAASLQDAEEVVDALTSGPCQMGLHAWLHKVDDYGETPLGLALAGGNMKSVQVVRAKLARLENPGSTIIDVAPGWDEHLKGDSIVQLELPAWRTPSMRVQEDGAVGEAQVCREQDFRRLPRDVCGVKGNIYRPFLVSIMGIACICVCVCLLMRGPQNRVPNFSWLHLDEGKL